MLEFEILTAKDLFVHFNIKPFSKMVYFKICHLVVATWPGTTHHAPILCTMSQRDLAFPLLAEDPLLHLCCSSEHSPVQMVGRGALDSLTFGHVRLSEF